MDEMLDLSTALTQVLKQSQQWELAKQLAQELHAAAVENYAAGKEYIAAAITPGSQRLGKRDPFGKASMKASASWHEFSSLPPLERAGALGSMAGGALAAVVEPTHGEGRVVSGLAKAIEQKAAAVSLKTADLSLSSVLDWSTYAHTLGTGVVPPTVRPMRDFSDKMQLKVMASGAVNGLSVVRPFAKVSYHADPMGGNVFYANLFHGELRFSIRAKGDRQAYGFGAEMVMSGANKYLRAGYQITTLADDWKSPVLTSNRQQFQAALADGLVPETAARVTFSGRVAERLALTDVTFDCDVLHPVFKHPDWGAGKQMNDYSLAYSRAHGRSQIDVTSRPAMDAALQEPMKGALQAVSELSLFQQASVLEQFHYNLAKQHNPISDHDDFLAR